MTRKRDIRTIGLFGFGAFGRLVAEHLGHHFSVVVHDPAAVALPPGIAARFGTLEQTAGADLVILAVPVRDMATAIRSIAPHVTPGALVADVGSVKCLPVRLMQEGLPQTVDIIGTHPLFGPQSAKGGLAGRKIVLCDVRGRNARRVGAFLRRVLKLRVFVTTPEDHDREAAVVQGLTHLIAKVLVQMEPLPRRLTTASFDQLMAAVEMVRHDAPAVYEAIERDNPFARAVRSRFFALADAMRDQLEAGEPVPADALAQRPIPFAGEMALDYCCSK